MIVITLLALLILFVAFTIQRGQSSPFLVKGFIECDASLMNRGASRVKCEAIFDHQFEVCVERSRIGIFSVGKFRENSRHVHRLLDDLGVMW